MPKIVPAGLYKKEDEDSDYEYDFSQDDERLIAQLADGVLVPSTEEHQERERNGVANYVLGELPPTGSQSSVNFLGVPRSKSVEAFVEAISVETSAEDAAGETASEDIVYPDLTSPETDIALGRTSPTNENPIQSPIPNQDDDRTPLARFRTYPKKPFSVTDLTAAAWCELQYQYTLTRLPGGKKTRTVAMKGGSKVHKKLEDEVHATVTVEIATREDAFGLKVWNVIQGLRTLRETGMTRELEVWGMIEGNVVNGLIDELSYREDQEVEIADGEATDRKITDFFADCSRTAPDRRKVYITDVKTRGVRSIPKGVNARPSRVQLFLYRRFVADMADDRLDYLAVFRRYGLDVDLSFTDSFLAQIGSLHDDIFSNEDSLAPADAEPTGVHESVDPRLANTLVRYGSLRELIPLLRHEISLTFPQGSQSLGKTVSIEYRLRTLDRDDPESGSVVGVTELEVNNAWLDAYLARDMQWWKGEREAEGVAIEEAHKCGYCEFAEICTWRKEMEEKNLADVQGRRRTSRSAAAAAAKAQAGKMEEKGGNAS